MNGSAPVWLMPVAAIFALQTVSAFLSRLIPIVAPAMSAEFGWDGSSIGYLSAGNALGGLVVLVAGSGLLKRLGGTRVLQWALLLGAASMALFLHPSIIAALLACFLMGMSNGAANPAGSEVLQRFSPPGKRNLIFSIKQAGVPLGGMIAGLCIPVIVVTAGWRPALLCCALLVLVPTVLTWKLSATMDVRRAPAARPLSLWAGLLQSLRTLSVPLASLTHSASLLKMSIVGSLFAVSQSCWFAFTVIYLVDGLDYSLSRAGLVFAVMQVGGVIGRVVLGWLADLLRSATLTLSITALFSALTTALLGLTEPGWPLWAVVALAFVAGCSVASWNGVQIAELARLSPSDRIGETAAGGAILVSAVNIVAPVTFALFVASTGRYDVAFVCVGVCTLAVLYFLPREKRAAKA